MERAIVIAMAVVMADVWEVLAYILLVKAGRNKD